MDFLDVLPSKLLDTYVVNFENKYLENRIYTFLQLCSPEVQMKLHKKQLVIERKSYALLIHVKTD